MNKLLTIGVIGKTLKDDEKRLPIHPDHIKLIPKNIREIITFEKGYAGRFGISDSELSILTSGKIASRNDILTNFDCVLLHKPTLNDLLIINKNTIVWGWPHCVQQRDIAQIAIEKKLTLIAFEGMYIGGDNREKGTHVFYKNNELAGFAGVLHSLALVGSSGSYGKTLKAVVLSFGSVSRGAIYALEGQGIRDVTVYTARSTSAVKDQIPGLFYKQMIQDSSGKILVCEPDNSTHPIIDDLLDADIIVNGTLQDVEKPKLFVSRAESSKLKKGVLIIDISCDKEMGFWCAKPTSFQEPILEISGSFYYSVDHTPSYYWNSSTWEISKALLPYIPIITLGPSTWKDNKTISNSIDILDGVIENSKILTFQNRESTYPHQYNESISQAN